ncbi:DUF4097 family beta strand repeat-containing protein [Streptomyces sp. NPDC049590]|uniref:DUF4097 family beta strand repeat-containing protein n=1 Tax=Streptomyces sp. NPDC049590 TaxID=3154834 RepID=UPI00342832DD
MNPSFLTRSCLSAVAAAMLSGALLTGCEGGAVSDQDTDTRSFTVSDKVTSLSIEASGGDIEVTGDSGTTVRVTETITYTGDRPKTGRQVSDGKLSLSAGPDCGPIDDSDCDMTYHVKVPSSLSSVRLVELGGSIVVKNLAGSVEAHTTGGSLRADELAGKSLVARVSGGGMTGNFTQAPDKVDVDTNGGNVSVNVPSTASYAVDAKSTGGKSKVAVTTDSGSAHTIKLRTVGGDVSLTS